MIKNIKTVIFDLDGVLWELDFTDFGRMIARDSGMPECYHEEFADKIIDAVKSMLTHTSERINKEVILKAITEGIPDLDKYGLTALQLYSYFINPNYVYSVNNPMALTVVKELHERGYKLVVKSNWFAHVQMANLKLYGYLPYFEQIVGIMDDYMKPNPRSVEKLLKGKDPTRCVIIGDSPHKEMKLANSLGMKSIWLNETGKPLPEDDSQKPTYEVHDIMEVLKILK
ncbi:MAG: HAD family hydrolase [Clostridia bacterium]|nr:HAD family hydrolase [Clostridia bacterium]